MIQIIYKFSQKLFIQFLEFQLTFVNRLWACSPTYTDSNLLYLAASVLPYHISGYTTRTNSIISVLLKIHADVIPMSRPGYPWDRKDRICEPTIHHDNLKEVSFIHVPLSVPQRKVFLFTKYGGIEILRVILDKKINMVWAASNHMNALPALWAAKRIGIPFCYEMRGIWELSRLSRYPEFGNSYRFGLGLALEGLVARNASQVFVISDQLKKYVIEHFGVPEERVSLLPNCIDPKVFQVPPPADEQPSTIVYAGSLIEYEGLDTLLRAVALLRDHGVPCKLNIAGDGEARPGLQAIVDELDLEGQVRFLGKLSPADARQLIAQAAIVCIPRKPYEVCEIVPPIKLVEAMAMAKPVVVPDLPVFRDELGSDSPGLFFRSGDVMDLARVLKEALENPKEMRVLGLRARAYVEQHRSWEPHIRNVLDTMNLLTSKVKVG